MRVVVLPALMLLLAAAPPPDRVVTDGPTQLQPGFDVNAPPVALPQPRKDKPLDPAVAQLIVARLVQLQLLAEPSDAQDPVKLGDAIRGFQSGIGSKPTGLLDRKTIALMAL